MKESIYGYHKNQKINFICITMALPKLIAPAKRILETGFKFGELPERGYSSYESNIDYEVGTVVPLVAAETAIVFVQWLMRVMPRSWQFKPLYNILLISHVLKISLLHTLLVSFNSLKKFIT